MDQVNKTEKSFFENNLYYFRLTLAVLLAFVGTYFNLPARGLISTLPVFLFAALISVIIKIPAWQKALLFGICAFIFASVDYNSLYGLFFAVLCTVSVFLCSLSFHLFKTKKAFPMLLAVLLIFACVVPHIYVFGNYPDALKANDKLESYRSLHYTNENTVVSKIYYDYKNKCYKYNVYDKNAPTEIYTLVSGGEYFHDSYVKRVEIELMYNRVVEITKTLRAVVGDENYDVIPVGIYGYPLTNEIFPEDTTDYNALMDFRIAVPGLTKEAFVLKSEQYYRIITNAGIKFHQILFTGSGFKMEILSIKVNDVPYLCNFSKLVAPPSYYGLDEQLLDNLKK